MTGLVASKGSDLPASARCLLLALAFVGLGSRGAAAVGLNDLNAFLFPSGGQVTGFVDAGPDSDRQIPASTDFLCVGSPEATFMAVGVCEDAADFELLLSGRVDRIRQNPVAAARTPSAGNPLVFDAIFTVTNNGPIDFPQGLVLLFTNVNVAPFEGSPLSTGYPQSIRVGLDQGPSGTLFELVALDGVFFYPGFALGPLGVGEVGEAVRVRYVLFGDDLPTDANGNFVLPPLSATGFAVPEPATALLLAAGLAGLAGRARSAA